MCSKSLKRWLLCSGLLLTFGTVLAGQGDLRTYRNQHFETVGLDLRSVSYVNELSLHTIQVAERYLEADGLTYPLPILVSLRPEEYVQFEGDHQIRLAARGAVELDILWEEPLTLERACFFISKALLVQYSTYNFGPDATIDIPDWLTSALATETYFSLRPSAFLSFRSVSHRMPLLDLSQVLNPDSGQEGNSEVGFWLFELLKADSVDRDTTRRLFHMALAGVDIREPLISVIQANRGPEQDFLQLQDWWVSGVGSLLNRDYEIVESMETTRAWLEALADFDAPLQIGEEAIELNLRSLWQYRDAEELRNIIQARYDILRLRLIRANPAYFNAAQALGSLFEALLDDSASHRYVYLLAIYLSDWEDAKEMQAELELVL